MNAPPNGVNGERKRKETGGAAFEPGATMFGRYRIERLLARGGMASVYEAIDVENLERVALKVLRKERSPDPETRERFRREAEILASIEHPGIVAIRGFGHGTDGNPWLAMELLEGETLRDRVERSGALAPEVLVPIVRSAAAGLDAAHARGVVHRDLKPENVFLPREDSAAKILDFGLSSLVGSAKLTRTGAVLGTPRYMAPEQIRSASTVDGRVDVYALGVIVHEALAGHSPFTASDHGQLLGAILTGRFEPLARSRPELAPEIAEVVARAMAHTRETRFATAGEFAESFAAAVRGDRPTLTSVAPPPPATASGRRRIHVAVAVALAIAAGGWLAYILGGA